MRKYLLAFLALSCSSLAFAADGDLFFEDFSDASGLERFTQLDANNDGKSWRWYGGEIFCSATDNNDMDDWLFTPALELEAGKTYRLSFLTFAYNSSLGSRGEVMMGLNPDPESMKLIIMPVTNISGVRKDNVPRVFNITPKESGTYYIGFHGMSRKRVDWNFYLDDIRIEAGVGIDKPADVTSAIVKPADDCSDYAEITLTVPDKTFSGALLENLTSVDIYRDGVLVKSFENPVPGETLLYKDEDVPTGRHEYEITATNNTGSSVPKSISAFVGPNLPLSPDYVKITETETPGKIIVEWSKVQKDVDGKNLQDGMVTYTISTEDHIIKQKITDNSYTYQALRPTDPMEFFQLEVYATTKTGDSDSAISPLVPVGASYTLPFSESFADGYLSKAWAVRSLAGNYNQWRALSDDAGIPSQDGDNGLVAVYMPYEGGISQLISGKIDLGTARHPALQTYYYNIEGGHNVVTLLAGELGGRLNEYTTYTNASPEGWSRIMVPIEDLAGKTIQFAIQAEMVNQYHTIFDNIKIIDLKETNVAVASISATKTAKPGDEVSISVDVENNGFNPVYDVKILLYRDGREVAQSEPIDIEPYDSMSVSFSETVSALFSDESVYYAVAVHPEDLDSSDDKSANVILKVDLPDYPQPTNLTAVKSNNGVDLTWQSPALDGSVVNAFTEDFESYTPGQPDSIGKWSIVDVDEDLTYMFENIDMPNAGQELGFMVFDQEWAGDDSYFQAHSGHQYAIAMAAAFGQNDDWLISPELNGQAQTVKFFAKTLSPQYEREAFEFLASSTGKNVDDFELVGFDTGVPVRWTPYSFDIPAGSKYFAIRCVSFDAFMFMVDDISFTPAGMSATPLNLVGYNVYRKGEKLNTDVVTAENYTDSSYLGDDTYYAVTALYNHGESTGSNYASVQSSGVSNQLASAQGKARSVAGGIIIEGASGAQFAVTDLMGRTIVTDTANADVIFVPATSGMYIVNINNISTKLIVK